MTLISKLKLPLFMLVGSLLLALIYSPALSVGFVYDDLAEIVQNTAIHDLFDPMAILKYNPARALLMLSFATEWHFFGHDPKPFHITNILIHLLNSLALLMVMTRVLNREKKGWEWAPYLAGLLFLVHPLFVESVTYIASRSSTLCTLFYLLTILSFSQFREAESQGKKALPWYALTTLFFFLAISTKEIAATLPATLILWDLTVPPRHKNDVGRWIWPHFLPWLSLFAFLALRISLVGSLVEGPQVRTIPENLLTETQVILAYLYRYILPHPLSIYHDFQTVKSPLSGGFIFGLIVHGSALLLALKMRKKTPAITFSILWFYITLGPTSSFIPLKEAMAEHRTYLPAIGVFTLLALGLSYLEKQRARLIAVIATLGVTGALAHQTHAYNQIWMDEIQLWEHATALAPHSADAHYALGDAYRRKGQMNEAITHYETAIKRYEDMGVHLKGDGGEIIVYNYPDALNNLGLAYAQKGDIDTAISHFRRAARAYPSLGAKAYTNLGYALMLKTQYKSAELALRNAVEADGNSYLAHLHLANLYYGFLSDRSKSLEHYRRVLAIAPDLDNKRQIEDRIVELSF